MKIFLELLFVVGVLLLGLPVFIIFFQTLSSLPTYKRRAIDLKKRPSITVLIPAHDESFNLIPTLKSVKAQLVEGDNVIVIADNCSDNTAEVALANGAFVLERNDEVRRGKGYALDFGVRYIKKQIMQPDVLVIVDADCFLEVDSLSILACKAVETKAPIQALYIMRSSEGANLKTKIAEFAWLFKNWVRPLGFMRLGLPCHLMGTGMAFPWRLIEHAEIASGHIVEDLKLGLDFSKEKLAPQFCPEAIVTSFFPLSNEGLKSQRTRWEHGHLGILFNDTPRLIFQSIKDMNFLMFALVIDMCVPPLALLTLLVFVLASLGIIGIFVTNLFMPWMGGLIIFFLLVFSILIAWVRFGRQVLSFANLTYAPVYVIFKIPVYLKFLIKRQVEWVRSHRD